MTQERRLIVALSARHADLYRTAMGRQRGEDKYVTSERDLRGVGRGAMIVQVHPWYARSDGLELLKLIEHAVAHGATTTVVMLDDLYGVSRQGRADG